MYSSNSDSEDDFVASGRVTPKSGDEDDSTLCGHPATSADVKDVDLITLNLTDSLEEALADWTKCDEELHLDMHSLADQSGVIVSVRPPKAPPKKTDHVPCDVVIVLDNSGSMGVHTQVPGTNESTGLDLLDLAKHSAVAILDSLDSGDRIGVVSFSTDAEVVMPLSYVTSWNRRKARKAIEKIGTDSATNMWAGIETGLSMWDYKEGRKSENVKAIYVLTDGYSNTGNPDHWESKLTQLLIQKADTYKTVPSIHTFGFGTSIQSGLLQLIAQVGKGNFTYISDPGMIATVFVNAVANLLATYATNVELVVEAPDGSALKFSATDIRRIQDDEKTVGMERMQVSLGNIQYGQSRDYVFSFVGALEPNTRSALVKASCRYKRHDQAQQEPSVLTSEYQLSALQPLYKPEEDYHQSRAKICEFIAQLCFATEYDGHIRTEQNNLGPARDERAALTEKIASMQHKDPNNKSLLSDLAGDGPRSTNPEGQIFLALEQEGSHTYYSTWGAHYLRSMLFAHATQTCNTFKDAGPLRYGADSPLFTSCRDGVHTLFNELPPPKRAKVKMSRMNNSSNVCWAPDCRIQLADGTQLASQSLRRGMLVHTPAGPRKVEEIVVSSVENFTMRKEKSSNLLITPWHPVTDKKSGGWLFPRKDLSFKDVEYTGDIYSLLLREDGSADAHAVTVDGRTCATLGHGITGGSDVRAHAYFGDYHRVKNDLLRLPRDEAGVLRCSKVIRNDGQMICGIGELDPAEHLDAGRLIEGEVLRVPIAV